MSYCHLDLVVASFVDFVCRLGYSFFIWVILFVILVFFIALAITLFVVSRYLIKNILLLLSSIS
jgi:heme exporter protein D